MIHVTYKNENVAYDQLAKYRHLSVDAAMAVAGNPGLAKLRTAQPKFVRRTYRALGL